jgi:hypothetical protein
LFNDGFFVAIFGLIAFIRSKIDKALSISKMSLCFLFCNKNGNSNINLSEKNSSVFTEEFSLLNLYLEYSEGLRCCMVIIFISYIYYKYLKAGWFSIKTRSIFIKYKQIMITLFIILFNLCIFGLLYEIIVNVDQLSINAIINWCVASIISIIDVISSIHNSQFTLTMDILVDSNINEYILDKDNNNIDEKLRNGLYKNLNDNNSSEEGKLNSDNSELREVQSSSSQENINEHNEDQSEIFQASTDQSNRTESDQSNQMQDNQIQEDEIRPENNEYNEEISEEYRPDTPDSGYQSARRSYSAEDWARDYRRLDEIRQTKADKYCELERIQDNLTKDMKRFGRDEDTEDYIKDLETEKHNIVSEVQDLEKEMEDARQVYWQLKKAEERAVEEARARAAAFERWGILNPDDDDED